MSKVRVFAHANRTFLLVATDGAKMLIRPKGFYDVPEKFTGDITYRRAVAAGDLQVFETTKQGDALERASHEEDAKNMEDTTSGQETASQGEDTEPNVESAENAETPEKPVATGSKGKGKGKDKAVDAE